MVVIHLPKPLWGFIAKCLTCTGGNDWIVVLQVFTNFDQILFLLANLEGQLVWLKIATCNYCEQNRSPWISFYSSTEKTYIHQFVKLQLSWVTKCPEQPNNRWSGMSLYEEDVLTRLMFHDPLLANIFLRVTKFKKIWKFDVNLNKIFRITLYPAFELI